MMKKVIVVKSALKCPKCGSENLAVDADSKGQIWAVFCLDCDNIDLPKERTHYEMRESK